MRAGRKVSTHRLQVAALLAGLACTDDHAITPPAAVSLAVFPDTATVTVADSVFLQAVATDRNGHTFVGIPTTWSARNVAVATVSSAGSVKGVAPGQDTIVATADALTAQGVVTVIPPPVIKFSRDSVGLAATANGPNPGPDSVVVTNAGGGTLTLGLGTVSYGAGASGWLTAALSSPTAPDTLVLTAQTGTLAVGTYTASVPVTGTKATNSPHTLKVTFTVSVGAAASMSKNAGDGQSATVATPVAVAPSVLVRDQYNNPVPNVSVTFAVTAGGGSITGATPATNASGVATVGSWTLGTTAGPNALSATSGALSGSPAGFTATGAPGPATTLAFTGQPTTAQAGVPITPAVQVSAQDAYGNTVTSYSANVAAAIGTNPGGSTLSGITTTAAASGVATFSTLSLDKTGSGYTLTATSRSLMGAPSNVFAINPSTTPAGSKSSLTALVASITASTGSTASPITVTVRDTFGNLIPGAAVALSATGTGNGFSPASSGTTNASGAFTATFFSTTAEAKTVRAIMNGSVAVTQTAAVTVTAGPVSAAASLLVVSPGAITASGGSSQSTITATARDQFSNPVSGATIMLFASPVSGNTLTQPAVVTTGTGQATGTLSSTVAGNKQVSATANGIAITQAPTVTVNAAAPATLTLNAGNSQTARVGFGVAMAPSVIVTDGFGNRVPAASVTFSALTGGGTLSGPNPATSDASGVAGLTGWTLGAAVGDSAAGTYLNSVTASASATTTVGFVDSAFYSLASDVMPIFAGCSGCHSAGFPPDFTSVTTFYNTTYLVGGSCNATYKRVQPGSWSMSLLGLLVNAAGPTGCAATQMPPSPAPQLSAAARRIISDWVQRSALNN